MYSQWFPLANYTFFLPSEFNIIHLIPYQKQIVLKSLVHCELPAKCERIVQEAGTVGGTEGCVVDLESLN